MQNNQPVLFIEINNSEYIFVVGSKDEKENFSLIYSKSIPQEGISNKRIDNLNLVTKIIKENIYLIEKKIDFIFKEVILIIDNFNCSMINLTGYKKLNGSQLGKDNVTYILNDLKTKLLEIEKNKSIIHIFNSNYLLDKKKINNLPIGLFGDFYSHELSFFLMDTNDYKNLQNVFDECNLKIKKIISKNFVLGTKIINDNKELENFLMIEINEGSIDLNFFENSAIRFCQKFNFGTNLIINDISKVIAMNSQTVKNILLKSNFSMDNDKSNFIEEEFFEKQNFRKIRKKLICEIASARIQEIAEIIIYKNINIKSFLGTDFKIFLQINDISTLKKFENIYKKFFSNNKHELKFLHKSVKDEFYENANNIVQYGWKKEAVPIVHEKKSLITRFFNKLFN